MATRTAFKAMGALRRPAMSYNPAMESQNQQITGSLLGAFRSTGSKRDAAEASETAKAPREKSILKKGADRNPELYTLGFIMTFAFAMVGYHFARKPTSSSSEQTVSMAENSYPWESGTSGKYQYHPSGDRTKAPKDAPSALHSVIVPNVNLPRRLHEQFNKYDKEEFDDY